MLRFTHSGDDHPYPLAKNFYRIVLPSIVILSLIISLLMGQGSKWLIEKIYLELSQRKSATINRAIEKKDAQTWQAIQTTDDPMALYQTPAGQHILHALREEVSELGLAHLKIYTKEAFLIYSSEEEDIAHFDMSDGYRQAWNGVNNLIRKEMKDGNTLYELYVRVPNSEHHIVMELYESIGYLDGVSKQIIIPAIVLPLFALLLITGVIAYFVLRAQDDINYRTNLISEFRHRLQKLVSQEAVSTLRSTIGKGSVISRRIKATVLFSDIRGFTNFCDSQSPEQVVSFLNQSLGIVIDAVSQNKGDVDKMIGDAVLAYFQGNDAEQRAFDAARQAITIMKTKNLPRGVGIGIYTGEVLIGTIGASNRMDFTIIGDTVNIASRLCSAAKEGEIVIDQQSFQYLFPLNNSLIERLKIKGKEQALDVVRIEDKNLC